MISANLTLEQGRELMCIPGSINNKNTEGIYKLLKNGATMVTTGDDVLNALGWEIIAPSPQPSPAKKKSSGLNKAEYLPIISLIEVEPRGFDELQAATNLNTEELLTVLTMMEIEGLIEQTNGDRYKKV